MDLTPVSIRGRHYSDKNRLAIVAWESEKSQSSIRALSRSKSESVGHRARKNKKATKIITLAMPTLEGLPQELLEMIFFYSMNINLPRASQSLGRQLSSHHVTMEFTMRSFFYTVDHRANIRSRQVTSDPQLQSDILSCRFFTYPFFLAYVQRAYNAMIRLRGKAWEKTGVTVPGVREFNSLFVYRFTKIDYLAFAEGFHIPEKLLHGPFTKDNASLLYVLVAFSGGIDWTGSMAGETAKTGMMQAMEENTEHAVASLSVLLGIQKAITTAMIKYAVLDCGCNINILRHLLFNAQILGRNVSKYILDFQDPELWAWAAANPSKGEVLTNMLRKADDFDLEFYFEDDADWQSIVGFPYSGSRFDAKTPLGRLVRELLTNLYTNHGRKITRRRVGGRS